MLSVRWFSFSAAAEKEIVRVVLEKLSYMRFDSDTELKSIDNNKTCELPDGIIIPVCAERFNRVDLWFQPNLLAKKPADSTTLLSCVQHEK